MNWSTKVTEIRTAHGNGGKAAGRVSAAVPDAVPGVGARDLLAALRKALVFLLNRVAEWHERVRQRRQLMEMEDRLLKDMGITRADVHREWRKPFWER